MIKIEQLASRLLETKLTFSIEQSDGTYKDEPFRVVFRDLPASRAREMIAETSREIGDLAARYDEQTADLNKRIEEGRERIIELLGDGDQKEIKKIEKEIAAWQAELDAVPPVPLFQHLYLAKMVTRLPDLVDDSGAVPEPTAETFARLGTNVCIAIDDAIAQRLRSPIEQKK